jgi:hypothetical protein
MLHVATMLAFFVDQVGQAPVVVQCPQSAPEPWWKWWAQSVIPVAGGTLIAVWSFVQNRKSEQRQWERNQEAGHEVWIRDQKRVEWKDILRAAADMEIAIPAVAKIQDRYDLVSKNLPGMIAQLLGARGACIFISDVLAREESIEVFMEFARVAASGAEYFQGFDVRTETDRAVRESCQTKYDELRNAYLKFCGWLQAEAKKDLESPTLSA